MYCSTTWAKLLGCMICLSNREVPVFAEESNGNRFHDQSESPRVANTATSKPEGFMICSVCRKRLCKEMSRFVNPISEALLQGKCDEGDCINLL